VRFIKRRCASCKDEFHTTNKEQKRCHKCYQREVKHAVLNSFAKKKKLGDKALEKVKRSGKYNGTGL